MRVVPPKNRQWFEVLPSPFTTEKPVVAFLIPKEWDVMMGENAKGDKCLAVCSKDQQKKLGLQLIDAELKTYEQHRQRFADNAVRMPVPAYVGLLSQLPQRLLLDEDIELLLFQRDEFWRRPLNLKSCIEPKEIGC